MVLSILSAARSYRAVFIYEANVPWPLRIPPHKIFITWRSLVLGVAGQHTLETHAHALNILNG